MAGDLHEVSAAIGALQASVKSFEERGVARDAKLDTLLDRTAALPDMQRHIDSHCDDLRTLNNYVQRIKGVMWSGRVAWVALAALFGAGWTIYAEVQGRFAKADERHNVIWSAITRMSSK